MNWDVLRVEALLPLIQALAATLLASALFALRLNRQGGSSRVALRRFLRFIGIAFAVAFSLATLWDARLTLRGVAGAYRGHPRDQYAMGLLRQSGRGFLARDSVRAAAWFQKAAAQGEPEAQLALARAALAGDGVPRNPAAALRFARASATGGNTDGMLLAGDLLKGPAPAQAQAYYQQALTLIRAKAEQGEAQAAFTLGFMYFRGQGMAPDPVAGFAWLLAADRLGLPGLQRVAILLESRQLTPAQRAQAAERAKALAPSHASVEGVRPKGLLLPVNVSHHERIAVVLV